MAAAGVDGVAADCRAPQRLERKRGVNMNDDTAIDMVLHCPVCGLQHIDAPEPANGWTNPPHKSHLCHGCKHIWRPADVPTNGVETIKTRGDKDSPLASASAPDGVPNVVANMLSVELGALHAAVQPLVDAWNEHVKSYGEDWAKGTRSLTVPTQPLRELARLLAPKKGEGK